MGPGVPGSSCTKNQDSVLFGPLPPSSPREICGACASRGRGGSWFIRLITSSIVACMSVPTANCRFRNELPWFANALSDCMPRRPCSARSCGSMISDSISEGAAARQLVKIEMTGSSMFGNSWIGSLTSANIPSSATMRMATSTPAGLRSEVSVRFIRAALSRPYERHDKGLDAPGAPGFTRLGAVPVRLGLPRVTHLVSDYRGAVLGDGHGEVDGAGVFLRVFVRLRQDLPIAPAVEVFLHHDIDWLRLVVAQLHFDLLFHPFGGSVDVEAHLAPLADDIERRAELHAHGFILGRVIDLVLTDELEAVVRLVELRHAQSSRGQRHAESKLLVVLELEVDV